MGPEQTEQVIEQEQQKASNLEEEAKDKIIQFTHLSFNKGRMTLAIDKVKGKFGYSFCSPLDHFRKSKGRMIAKNRLLKKPLDCYPVLYCGGHWDSACIWCLCELRKNNKFPKWMLKQAKEIFPLLKGK